MVVHTTKEKFIKMLNKVRREDKNKWYFVTAVVDGKEVKIKGYGTWLQIFKINEIDYSNVMEQSVKEFNNYLQEVL